VDGGAGGREVGGLPSAPPCPFCEASETELMSAFGAHASVSTYWCRRCRSPFDLLKWRPRGSADMAPSPGRPPESAPDGDET
jgi:hypothetical protein